MANLRIIDGHGKGKAFALTGQRVTIGRDAANLIQVGDPKSSRYHAELVQVTNGYELRDLGSSNGTWNEQGRIDVQAMAPGTIFRIGKTYLRFEDETAAKVPAAEVTLAGAEDEGWADPAHIQGIDPEQPELLRHREMADPRILERANAYLVLLHQLVLRATEAKNRDQLFELLDDAAADVLEGDRCAVFLPTPDAWSLWPTHERRVRASAPRPLRARCWPRSAGAKNRCCVPARATSTPPIRWSRLGCAVRWWRRCASVTRSTPCFMSTA